MTCFFKRTRFGSLLSDLRKLFLSINQSIFVFNITKETADDITASTEVINTRERDRYCPG